MSEVQQLQTPAAAAVPDADRTQVDKKQDAVEADVAGHAGHKSMVNQNANDSPPEDSDKSGPEIETLTIGKPVEMSPIPSGRTSVTTVNGVSILKFTLVDQVNPDMEKLLQCGVCSTTSVPPVYTCGEGHNICYLCHTVGSLCGCGSGFTRRRNELAEHVVGQLKFKCADERCTKGAILGREVKDHAKTCEFRPVPCKIHNHQDKLGGGRASCDLIIPLDDYFDHLKEKHNVIGIDGSSTVVNMSTTVKLGQGNWTFPPQYLKAFGKTFFCHFHASYNLIIGWISLCGTSEEVSKYAGSVTIFHPHQKWKQVKWMGQVHSFRSTSEEVYESGNCLILLPETFLMFAQVEPLKDEDLNDEDAVRKRNNNVDASKRVKKWNCHFEVTQIHELEKFHQAQAVTNTTETTAAGKNQPTGPPAVKVSQDGEMSTTTK